MTLHIAWARKDFEARRIIFCPTEDKRRRAYSRYQHWYGWTTTCLGCGDSWMDGEMAERPFERGWRPKRIAKAKRDWAGVMVTARERRAAFRAMMAEYAAGLTT